MRRRDMLRLATAATLLAAPRVARSRSERTLKFVPLINLALLDPVFSGNRATHNHAYLVFDTLYGLDETLTARPQMVEGHTVDDGWHTWSLRLREGLRFHDDTPVLARDVVASVRRFAARDQFGQALMAATGRIVRARRSHGAVPPHQAVSAFARRSGRILEHDAGDHAGTSRQRRSISSGAGDGRKWALSVPAS